MSITEDTINLNQFNRKRLDGLDVPIRRFSEVNSGRDYKSTTFQSNVPLHPHVMPELNLRKNGFNTIISVSVDPAEGKIPNLDTSSPYECLTSYFNKTTYPIRIVDRNNFSFTLPKAAARLHNEQEYLVIRKLHRFESTETAKSILINYQQEKNLLCVENGEREQIIKQIEEAVKQGMLRNYTTHLEITIDRIIPINLFSQTPSMYVSDLDLLLVIDGINIESPHPMSPDAMLRGELLEKIGTRKITGAFYEIVDNSSEFDYRYICLGKNTFKIPINKDPGKQQGIYYTEIDNLRTDNLEIRLEHIKLTDAETIGIYNTKEMAETRGHVNDVLKADNISLNIKVEKLQAENKLLEIERKRELDHIAHEQKVIQNDSETENLKRKRETSYETSEIDRLNALRKDFYEDISMRRKNTSEIIKWAPTVVGGLIALGGVFAIARSSKS